MEYGGNCTYEGFCAAILFDQINKKDDAAMKEDMPISLFALGEIFYGGFTEVNLRL
ncbi:hypothetical protein C943_03000 [Mariniradius saccharolyticus AK6]|uniref:Uncharacterized protein n=1 Tax=Mariniradius saccharolyticus AK6 TaxID=1239962 RepID=M7Y2X2_9BACT|nr:hypothetical protein C943_03000 [Mariniradius saccharolyticus AK6]